MNMYGHRPPGQHSTGTMSSGAGNGRIPELLEALRAEYEALQQEFNFVKHQREDLDSKCTQKYVYEFLIAVVNDIGLVQKILFDLERTHIRMKQQ